MNADVGRALPVVTSIPPESLIPAAQLPTAPAPTAPRRTGRRLSILDDVRVASPCSVPWASMHGDERVRFCDSCKLNVFNLSDMTRADAEALILQANGRICIRYYQRSDGTILTRDCPIGLWRLRRRFIRSLAGVAAGFACVAGSMRSLARGDFNAASMSLAYCQPFKVCVAWLDARLPKGFTYVTVGAMAYPPIPPPPPSVPEHYKQIVNPPIVEVYESDLTAWEASYGPAPAPHIWAKTSKLEALRRIVLRFINGN